MSALSHSSLPPPPPPPVDDRRWGFGDAFLTLAVFFFVSLVVGIFAFGIGGDDDVLKGAWLPIAVGLPPAIQLGHVLWIGRAKGRGAREDFGFRFRPSDLAVGAGVFVAGVIAAGAIGSIIFEVFDREPSASVAEMAEDSAGGSGITVWIVLLAVLAVTLVPVVEELVFRGLWWSALAKRGMGEGACLVITSAAFALFHFEPLRSPVLFVLGMALGFGRIRTGRIGASIAGHAYINALGMTALLIDLA